MNGQAVFPFHGGDASRMSGNVQREKHLSAKQYRAIAALLTCGDITVAAQAADVDERTIRRWLALDTVQWHMRQGEAEIVQRATRRLSSLTDKALSVLEGILDNKDAADNPRIRAAATVLEICLKWREQVELEERIRKLEQHVEGNTR